MPVRRLELALEIWSANIDEPEGGGIGDALSKSWFGSFNNERVYAERFETRESMKIMPFEYIQMF